MTETKFFRIKDWKPSAQPPNSANELETQDTDMHTAVKNGSDGKAQMKREIKRLRHKNEQERLQKISRKRGEKAALKRLSTPEQRKKFILSRKAEAKAAGAAVKAEAAERKKKIAAMSPDERKAFRKEQRYQRQLKYRASRAFIPLQILKYAGLAAAAAGIVYLGIITYGVFFDNSYAFQNTGQAIARPSVNQQAGISDTTDPYSLLLSGSDLDFMKERVNILVMGVDNNEERDDPGSYDRTDTMLLISVNFETNEAYLISLPRDSYVWIYNKDYRGKLNGAFSAGGGFNGGGFECATRTVSMLLGGIPVNNYVCFDMEVVMDVVDAMGGIDYDVDVSFNLDGRSLEPGFQHLDGQQVLDYCRVRENITGGTDIARTSRQRNMITAIFSYMKANGQLQDIPGIYSAVASNIFTDLTFEQINSLAAFSLKLDSEDLHDYLLPGKYLDMEDASFWGIDQDKKQDMIYEIFGQTIQFDPDDDVDTLLELVEQKNDAIAAGQSALSAATSYVSSNSAYITAEQRDQYNALKKALQDAMEATNPRDIESTIRPITEATNELNAWIDDIKPLVEAAASATPTPEPSAPEPSESIEPDPSTPTGTPSATLTPTA